MKRTHCMALLSTIVTAVAQVEGMDEAQVGWIARHLREAGLISQAGRGRGAAHMTTRDAAILLIGANTASSAKDAAASTQLYRSLHGQVGRQDPLKLLQQGAEFGKSFEAMIELCGDEKQTALFSDKTPAPGLVVEFFRPGPMVWVTMNTVLPDGTIRPSSGGFNSSPRRSVKTGDRQDRTLITIATLKAVAAALKT